MKTETKHKSGSLGNIRIKEQPDGLNITVIPNHVIDRLEGFLIYLLVIFTLGFFLWTVWALSRTYPEMALLMVIAMIIRGLLPSSTDKTAHRNPSSIIITNHGIQSGKVTLCAPPYKAIYIRAVSKHRRFPYSVIVNAGVRKHHRVELFKNLSHEQAVYIARVIHRYLKLDAPEGDFIEPEIS